MLNFLIYLCSFVIGAYDTKVNVTQMKVFKKAKSFRLKECHDLTYDSKVKNIVKKSSKKPLSEDELEGKFVVRLYYQKFGDH